MKQQRTSTTPGNAVTKSFISIYINIHKIYKLNKRMSSSSFEINIDATMHFVTMGYNTTKHYGNIYIVLNNSIT